MDARNFVSKASISRAMGALIWSAMLDILDCNIKKLGQVAATAGIVLLVGIQILCYFAPYVES